MTPWTVLCQAPLSMGFSRQEYWSELPFPPAEDLPNPGIKRGSSALQAVSSLTEPSGSPLSLISSRFIHTGTCDRISLLLKAEQYSIVWIYCILFPYPFMDFSFASTSWLIVKSITINMDVEIFFLDSTFNSFGFIPNSGISGSWVLLMLVYRGISILSSIVAVSIFIPANSARGFSFFQSLSSIY